MDVYTCGCAEVEKSRSLEVQGPVGRYRPAIVFLVEAAKSLCPSEVNNFNSLRQQVEGVNRAALVRLIILIA